MHIIIDTLTVGWMVALLFVYAPQALITRTSLSWLGLFTVTVYLLAQSSWTVAWILGDEWGRDFANYIWFVFNTSVCAVLTCVYITNFVKEAD
jgi:hypothetical protein